MAEIAPENDDSLNLQGDIPFEPDTVGNLAAELFLLKSQLNQLENSMGNNLDITMLAHPTPEALETARLIVMGQRASAIEIALLQGEIHAATESLKQKETWRKNQLRQRK